MELSKFKQDTDKTENGTWVDVGDGLLLLIAKSGNRKSLAAYQRLMKPYKQMQERGMMPEDKVRELNVRLVAESILLGWQGLTDNGVTVPYSPEKAYEILSDPAFSELLSLVQNLSSEPEVFKSEDPAGN